MWQWLALASVASLVACSDEVFSTPAVADGAAEAEPGSDGGASGDASSRQKTRASAAMAATAES